MNENITVLFTNTFPYTKIGESFLESEINYHKGKVFIFPGVMGKVTEKRDIPENCRVFLRQDKNKLIKRFGMLLNFFSPIFLKEIILLLKSRRFNLYNVKEAVKFIWESKEIYKFVKKTLSDNNITVDKRIVFYSYWMHYGACAAVLLKEKFSKSVAVTRCHRYDLYEEEMNGYIPFRNFLIKNLDMIYPISEDGKNYIIEKYSVYNDNIRTFKLGTVDYGIKNNKKDGIFTILSCSSVYTVKRVHLIVEGLAKLDKLINIKINWIHFGGGPLLDDVKKLADLNLGNSVNFSFPGIIKNEDVLTYYNENNVHLFINVSESEGIPVSIMEAISFGTPVIATNVGGNSEIVKDKYNGFLLDKNFEAQELSELIMRFYNMENSKYLGFRQHSRKVWENEYSADTVYKHFVKTIHKEGREQEYNE